MDKYLGNPGEGKLIHHSFKDWCDGYEHQSHAQLWCMPQKFTFTLPIPFPSLSFVLLPSHQQPTHFRHNTLSLLYPLPFPCLHTTNAASVFSFSMCTTQQIRLATHQVHIPPPLWSAFPLFHWRLNQHVLHLCISHIIIHTNNNVTFIVLFDLLSFSFTSSW